MTARRFALALALLAALPLPATLGAQVADALFAGFEPWGEYRLFVDGREAPKARLYWSQRAQAVLVRSAELDSPVLLDVPGRTVQTVDLMKVAERPDGTVDLLADAALSPAGALTVGREAQSFTVGGKRFELRPSPYLLGAHEGADLLAHDPGYRFRAARFEPDAAALARLRAERRQVRVLTLFGSWCPHCREHVPFLLKTEQALAGSNIDFDYYGLPSTGLRNEPEASKWGVTGVPTSIVLVDGREVGRIPNSGWTRPERAVAELLGGTTAAR
jgi:thiol-disulfide isomerase/thioredoxin